MKSYSIIFNIAACVAVLASCAKDGAGQEQKPTELQPVTINVSYPDVTTTKVLLDDEDGVLLWDNIESIAVVFNDKTVYKFDKVSGTSSSAKFGCLIDPVLKKKDITEVFYPYKESYSLEDYKTNGVSTTQNNIALVQGRYNVDFLPLHWKGDISDGITLTADRSAIVFISKDDLRIVDNAVTVAFYSDEVFIQDYTINIGSNEDLVFIVDIPEVQNERKVEHPVFVLNQGKGGSDERGSIRTAWVTSNNTQKSMVPSKRYALYPYIVLYNADAQVFSKLNTKDLNDAMVRKTIYKANWEDVAGSNVLGQGWSFNSTDILYNGKTMYYTNAASGSNSVKLTPSTLLIETDHAVISSNDTAAGTDQFTEEEYNPFKNVE